MRGVGELALADGALAILRVEKVLVLFDSYPVLLDTLFLVPSTDLLWVCLAPLGGFLLQLLLVLVVIGTARLTVLLWVFSCPSG